MSEKFEKLTKCLYCGSSNLKYLYTSIDRFSNNKEEKFELSKCLSCGFVFQSLRVKEEYIGEYYEGRDDLAFSLIPQKKKNSTFSKIKKAIFKQTMLQHFNYRSLGKKNLLFKIFSWPFKRVLKIKLTPVFVEKGKLLEIGCSYGGYLQELKDLGWNVVGRELDKGMVEYAQSTGLNVSAGRIEEIDFKDGEFNVVIMSMVLEHLYEPFVMLDRATKWLSSNGQLIFSIPNIDGLEFYFYKEYTYALQLPHHITFLDKKIIREYLTKIGYKKIKFYYQFFDREAVASAGYKYEETSKKIYKVIHGNKLIRYVFIKPLIFILSLLGMTSRVTVHAVKK